MKIAKFRAGEAVESDLAGAIYERYKAGADVSGAVTGELIDRAIDRYAGHFAAKMRANGFEIGEGEPLTLDVLVRAVNQRTGLDIADLTPDGIAVALDSLVAKKIGDALGVDITSVSDIDAMKEEVMAGALAAVKSGKATKLISQSMIHKIRVAATWASSGVPPDERRAMLLRGYQKKFRKTHVQKWL